MNRRQTLPQRWLIVDSRTGGHDAMLRSLPRGSGIVVLHEGMSHHDRVRLVRRLRYQVRTHGHVLIHDKQDVARVHSLAELRAALLSRARLVMLSPIHATQSHPDWRPLRRFQAAAFARLARGSLIALGGMGEARFRRVRQFGFRGWAGIDAFRT